VSGDTAAPYSGKKKVADMSKYHQLTQEERYRIAAHRIVGDSSAQIAIMLGRHRSTIGREVRRNARTHDGSYGAEKAHGYARARLRRCRRGPQFSDKDMARVDSLVRRKWSPEQIAGFFKKTRFMSISHETIYRRLRREKKSGGGDLWKSTRIMSKFGRKRYRSHDSRGVLPGKRHISERPAEVELRKRIGHWEGDTVMGSDMRHCILTLVERVTGYVIIKKLRARSKAEVTKAATRAIRSHYRKFRTITFDNGTEFHDYKLLEDRFTLKCYFATPYHSWERGSNENMNGLIRQYLPKGECMSRLTQARCDYIAHELNTRPRKRHGYSTPADLYQRH
jgi:transposase, IS30 family